MNAIQKNLRMLLACRRGATAVEYGLIVSLIVIAMSAALEQLGGGATGMWGKIASNVLAH